MGLRPCPGSAGVGGGGGEGGSHAVPEVGGETRRRRLWGSRRALQGCSPASVCGQATQSTHKPRGAPQGRRLRKHWTEAVALDFPARSSTGMLPVPGCGPRPFPRTPRGCIGLSAQPILRSSAVSAGSRSLATSISTVLTSLGSPSTERPELRGPLRSHVKRSLTEHAARAADPRKLRYYEASLADPPPGFPSTPPPLRQAPPTAPPSSAEGPDLKFQVPARINRYWDELHKHIRFCTANSVPLPV